MPQPPFASLGEPAACARLSGSRAGGLGPRPGWFRDESGASPARRSSHEQRRLHVRALRRAGEHDPRRVAPGAESYAPRRPGLRPPRTMRSACREPAPLRRSAMSARQLLAAPVDELPECAPVEPSAFVDDDRLPGALSLVEPAAFALACSQALWGDHGPRN